MLYKAQRQFEPAAEACEQSLALARKRHSTETDAAVLPFHVALASLYLAEDAGTTDESNAETPVVNSDKEPTKLKTAALDQADAHIQAALKYLSGESADGKSDGGKCAAFGSHVAISSR